MLIRSIFATRMPAALLAATVLWSVPAGRALAQDANDPPAEQEGDTPPDDTPSQLTFPDGATSDNNELLGRILERFPDADTDNDGVLDADEGRAFFDEQRQRWRDQQQQQQPRNNPRDRGRVRVSVNDLAYGPEEDQRMDLYIARSNEPTPLVVYFHGGQFITGDESDTGTLDIADLLSRGISVASVDYRDARHEPFPASFEDAAQAVQFLRLHAQRYNLDPDRFAGHGEEAGGNLALYLALHDDLAEKTQSAPDQDTADAADDDREDAGRNTPDWDDPKLKTMSTRLSCAVARHPIATFDPREWKKHKLPMNGHERLMCLYLDVRFLEPLDDADVIKLVEDVSPLALVSPGDPELLLMSQYEDFELEEDTTWVIMSHHPRQSMLIAQAMKAAGNQATVRYRGMDRDPGTSSVDFFVEKLLK